MKKLLYILLFLTITVQAQVPLGSPVTSIVDVFPKTNAASISDNNSTSGWSNTVGNPTISVDGDSYHGDYAIRITSTAITSIAEVGFPTQSGKTYKITMRAKRGVGTSQQFKTWLNVASGFDTTYILSTSYSYFTFHVTPTIAGDDIVMRVYASRDGSGGAIGDSVIIDKIQVIEK